MNNEIIKTLNKKGYTPIFLAIDNSKRQLKNMQYSRNEIEETLIDMFGKTDSIILKKIKER